jgi:hypothetical protein
LLKEWFLIEMKSYIFLTSKIGGIGGSQLYLRNKIEFLENHGWATFIIYTNEVSIEIKELKEAQGLIYFPEFRYHPASFSKRGQLELVGRLYKMLDADNSFNIAEQIIVETHFVNQSLWGDLLSKSIGAKHLIYLLSDRSLTLRKEDQDFFHFKLKNQGLAIINERVFPRLFPNLMDSYNPKNVVLNAGILHNSMKSVPHETIDQQDRKDVNIGCIARLDKPFVNILFHQVVDFANLNPGKSILFLLIGSSDNGILEEDFEQRASVINNLTYINVTSTYPIPRQIISFIDVFISSAGGASVCAYEGALTLAIDVMSAKPIGFLGIDAENSLFSSEDSKYSSILDTLEQLFSKKESIKEFKSRMHYKTYTPEANYNKHLEFSFNIKRQYHYKSIISPKFKFRLVRFIFILKRMINGEKF